MDKTDGWVKLWRMSIDSIAFSDPDLWKLWTLCLMLSNHKTNYLTVSGCKTPIKIEEGQFLTGRYELHKKYYPRRRKKNKSAITVWRWMQTLEKAGNIEIKSNNHFSIVTICKWKSYQSGEINNEQRNDQQVISRRSAGDQQVITNKNVNNVNNVDNVEKQSFFSPPLTVDRSEHPDTQSVVLAWLEATGRDITNLRATERTMIDEYVRNPRYGAEKVRKLLVDSKPVRLGFILTNLDKVEASKPVEQTSYAEIYNLKKAERKANG